MCNYMCVITACPHFGVTQAKWCESRHAKKKQMIVAKAEFSEIYVVQQSDQRLLCSDEALSPERLGPLDELSTIARAAKEEKYSIAEDQLFIQVP